MRDRPAVSILTQPEGWVQPSHKGEMPCMLSRFQSSPNPKAGCNLMHLPEGDVPFEVSILTQPEGWVQPQRRFPHVHRREGFNPHPTRRLGATLLNTLPSL